MLLAFGAGLLTGTIIESHFWCSCIGICLLFFGFASLKHK